tara:strand:+ start:709 stop:1050 length:342 start_codon:yes stop_codon:yes gene_type:complete
MTSRYECSSSSKTRRAVALTTMKRLLVLVLVLVVVLVILVLVLATATSAEMFSAIKNGTPYPETALVSSPSKGLVQSSLVYTFPERTMEHTHARARTHTETITAKEQLAVTIE